MQYMLGVRSNLRLRRGDVARGRGGRARVAGDGRAVRRQPVPGADRDRAAAGAPWRRRGRRDARGGVGARGGDAGAAAARAGGGGAGRARVARRRPRTRRSRSRGRRTSSRPPAATPGRARSSRFWLWRGGEPVAVAADDSPPYARSIAGDWRGAAAEWASIGFPYERAEALCEADEEDARLEALALIDDVRRRARRLAPAPAPARRGRAPDPARPAARLSRPARPG